MEPIKILGAGPAGLTAAITLAQAGQPVIVYERAADVGTRRAGDTDALENWTTREDVWDELNGWSIARNVAATPIHTLTAFGPGFRERASIGDRAPLFYLVVRGAVDGSLDRALLAQARAAGAQVQFNRRATPAEVDLVAGGHPRPSVFAVGYRFETRAPNGAYVCLDDDLTPQSYSYLELVEGRGTIAACALTPRRGAKEILPQVIRGFQSQVEFEMREPHYFAASIGYALPETARRGDRLYAGEAAGFQDWLTGFGLRTAITTGYQAAQSLLDGRDYDALWRARAGRQIESSAVNRWIQETAGQGGYGWLLRYLRLHANAGRALLRRHYAPGGPQSILKPFVRRLALRDQATSIPVLSQSIWRTR